MSALSRDLEIAKLLRPAQESRDEPQFRYLASTNGKALAQAYAALHTPREGRTPIFTATILPAPSRRGETSYFPRDLLRQTGISDWQRGDAATRLEAFFREQDTELAIFLDFDRLLAPTGKILVQEVHWLIHMFKVRVRQTQMLAVSGNLDIIRQILGIDIGYVRRFKPIRLPSEPEEPDNPETRRELRRLLGFPEQ